jgi:hypothetical protein
LAVLVVVVMQAAVTSTCPDRTAVDGACIANALRNPPMNGIASKTRKKSSKNTFFGGDAKRRPTHLPHTSTAVSHPSNIAMVSHMG